MKFDRNKAFPYPVLRPYNDDFIDRDFQAAVSVEVSESSVNISIEYSLSSRSIKKLIDAHEASFVTVVSCRDTYFSQAIESFDEHAEKVLPHGLFRGEVLINKYIQILDDISFKTTEVHPDFGTGPFLYTKGDVIAQDEPEKFYFGREFFKPLTSIFSLVKNIIFMLLSMDLLKDAFISRKTIKMCPHNKKGEKHERQPKHRHQRKERSVPVAVLPTGREE